MTFVWMVALLVASYVLTSMTAKRPEDAKPTAMEDFDLPVAEEGTPQIVVFGDCWVADWMVLWYGDFATAPIYSRNGKK